MGGAGGLRQAISLHIFLMLVVLGAGQAGPACSLAPKQGHRAPLSLVRGVGTLDAQGPLF